MSRAQQRAELHRRLNYNFELIMHDCEEYIKQGEPDKTGSWKILTNK